MVRKTYTILHKSEWDRLRRQGEVLVKKPAEGASSDKHEYLKALNEKSQEWIKHWPDNAATRARELEKQKRRQLKKDLALVKAYVKKQKPDNTEAIRTAKQMIFYHTCYGRKLVGALIESRTLKVRDAQIEFKNKLRAEIMKQSKKDLNEFKEHDFLNFNDKEKERIKLQTIKTLECNRYNQKSMIIKKDKELKIKKEERECAVEDSIFMQEMFIKENKAMEELKMKEQQAIKQFEAERKAIDSLKARRAKLNDDLIEVYKNAQDKKNKRIKEVFKQIHEENSRTKRSNELFEIIDRIQKDKNKELKDFVELAINKSEERRLLKEKKLVEQENEKRLLAHAIAKKNKLTGESKNANASHANGYVCDRQTILPKNNRKSAKIGFGVEANHERILDPTFSVSRNSLVDKLRVREKERSPWNGTQAAHEQFARNAAAALDECDHKYLVHKVIEEYRKNNFLDGTTLPIPNYYN